MKKITTLSCLTLALALSASAQQTETKTEKSTTTSPDGTVSRSTTTTTRFNPETQQKVVQYFETYKSSPYGLPPAWTSQVKVKQLPTAWRTGAVTTGTVITQEQRNFLVEAPKDLVKILPAPTAEVRYYVAGGNVVAVDKTYKVVDTLRIPSVKFDVEVEDGGKEIEIKRKD